MNTLSHQSSFSGCMISSQWKIPSIDDHHDMVHFLSLNETWYPDHMSLNMIPILPNCSMCKPLKMETSISPSISNMFFLPGQELELQLCMEDDGPVQLFPPCSASCKTVLVPFCVPLPQVFEQLPQVQSVQVQFTTLKNILYQLIRTSQLIKVHFMLKKFN